MKKEKQQKTRVLVAISGGVDSAVSAALLIKQGFDITGAFMKCYSDIASGQPCWIEDWREALRVCAKLGIKLLVFDFEKEYRKSVVDYLFREYRVGNTPNPDVMCNKFVKFPLLLKQAKKLGFDFVATGHYARVSRRGVVTPPAQVRLLQAVDDNKDQTYFLHQLKQKDLQHILFPIGEYTKPEVRVLARKFDLPVAEREESMGICFVGEVPIRQFLLKKIKPRPGKIILADKTVVGTHTGLPFYTIGQRVGVQIPKSKYQISNKFQNPNAKPVYVVGKNKKKNELIVGFESDSLLYKKECAVNKVNWIAGQPKLPLSCLVRLRHRQPLQKATICHSERSGAKSRNPFTIRFAKPQRAITPGQFAVFYSKGECMGGGEII